MSIGYVCMILSVPDIKMKSCILKNATPERLLELSSYNIEILDKMIDYNVKNNIKLFRISSHIIPFASHPVNQTAWDKIFTTRLKEIGDKAVKNGIRLSMHPGQYTTLSSPNADVVAKSVRDLEYHAKFLDCMGLDSKHKLILHIGGVYGDKKQTIKRFVKNYKLLAKNIRKRLVIENDDKNYTAKELLYISKKTGAPVIFDYLHHILNNEGKGDSIEILRECGLTWKTKDGIQKIHYSQQAKDRKRGSHSLTIDVPEFLEFYKRLPPNIDVMLEVKDKDVSAIKCLKNLV